MLILKKGSELLWSELRFIEVPSNAKNTLMSNNNGRTGTEPTGNAAKFSLPTSRLKAPDAYGCINHQLEDGQVFLINSNTRYPVFSHVAITQDNSGEWEINPGQNLMFMNALDAVLHQIHIPQIYGVTRAEPAQTNSGTAQPKKDQREKHKIVLNLQTEQGHSLPSAYTVSLVVVNDTQKSLPVRQIKNVVADNFSKVFTAEKGNVFKIYAITDDLIDVKKDLNKNKNLDESQKNNRISVLTITKTETMSDGVLLHTVELKINPPLRMGIFFDGTGNDAHKDTAWSNVKLLSDAYERQVKNMGVSFTHGYVRGVGSKGDNFIEGILGSAAGIGAFSRIAGMLDTIEAAIIAYTDEYNILPNRIYFDVFGFSRGATTARHFINVVKQGFYGFKDEHIQKYITPSQFEISFAGLFDSVGSYGLAGDNDDYGYNFHIRPQWLKEGGRVCHFIALNEYRANFDLQTLLGNQDRHYPRDVICDHLVELGFIGAHSDVGGGYEPNQQGVKNEVSNPTQLSVMPLQEMHKYALASGVPLTKLKLATIEKQLSKNYEYVMTRLRADMSFRTLWMKWCGYNAQAHTYERKIQKLQARIDRDIKFNRTLDRHETRRLSRLKGFNGNVKQAMDKLEYSMQNHLGSASEVARFIGSFKILDEYYIHESHSPFNGPVGMGPQEEEDDKDINYYRRTIFFKEAVDFNQRNDELDRIRYVRGKIKKVDIDEFDLIVAEPFE